MIGLAFRAFAPLALALAVAAALGGAYLVLKDNPPAPSAEQGQADRGRGQEGERGQGNRRDSDGGANADRERGGQGESLSDRLDPVSDGLEVFWGYFRLVLLGVAVLVALLLATRAIARSRRRYRWLQIVPHRSDAPGHHELIDLFEAWRHQQLRRWYERLLLGQPSLALMVVHEAGEEGGESKLLVAVEDDDRQVAGFLGALRKSYENVRVREWQGELPELPVVVRLKKRAPHNSPLKTPFDVPARAGFEHTMDGLVATLGSLAEPVVVQIALWPAPLMFEGMGRAGAREAEQAHVRRYEGYRHSEMAAEEFEGAAVGVAWRSLYFADIRVAAQSKATARQVAGVIRGDTRQQNELRPRHMIVRGRLYRRRIRKALGNPLPSWKKGVLATAELASLWRLPDPFENPGEVERDVLPVLAPPRRVPRVPKEEGLLRSQTGEYVGAREHDLRFGTAIIGGQYAGKSSLLLRWFEQRVAQPNCAGILLDPKGDASLEALRHLPPETVVHYIDCGAPEAGISPLAMKASPSQIAEAVEAGIVEAYRTDKGEAQSLQSARRFINQVTKAAVRTYDPATFWHLWMLLSPEESVDQMRLKLSQHLVHEREMAAVALAFEQLAVQLQGARSAMIQRLDSPANKIYGLLDANFDAVLRHPHQVDVAGVIERREVLVINGAVGQFGPEYTSMLMLMALSMIHRVIAAQQQLPAHERADVALALDEAWMMMSPTLAEVLALDRSAGLMAAAAWHMSAQISDPNMRATALGLLRNRYFFALERRDARELAEHLQPVHIDSFHAREEVREQLRIGPEVLARMPQHYCAVDQYVDGHKVDSFIGETIPMEEGERGDLERHHLEAQRARGGHLATDDELRPPEGVVLRERRQAETMALGSGAEEGRSGGDEDGAGLVATLVGTPSPRNATTVDQKAAKRRGDGVDADGDGLEPRVENERTIPAPGTPTGVELPASFKGLSRYEKVSGVKWDPEKPCRNPRPRSSRRRTGETEGERRARRKGLWVLDERGAMPDARELEILKALWEFEFLESGQIAHHFLGHNGRPASSSTVSDVMRRLHEEGWVRRLKLATGRGRPSWVYTIARGGFELCRIVVTSKGHAISEDQRWPEDVEGEGEVQADDDERRSAKEDRPRIVDQSWRRSEKKAAQSVLHELGVAEWALRFGGDLAANCVREMRGAKRSWLLPPTRTERGERRQLRVEELRKQAPGEKIMGLAERWGALRPDASFELELESATGRVRRVDLFLEYERGKRPNERIDEKLRSYDAYRTGWWRATDRYGELHGEPAIVVFVVPDGEAARRYAERADQVMTGMVALVGYDPEDARYPGREGVFFCAEADVHQRALRAYGLRPMPPALRERGARNARERAEARNPGLRQVAILPNRYLDRPAEAGAGGAGR